MSEESERRGNRIAGRIGDVTEGGMAAIGKDILQIRAEPGSTVVVEAHRTQAEDHVVHAPPAARRRLYGREPALQQVTEALREQETVLLAGSGGMGKTALALKVAETLHGEKAYKDGVLWLGPVGSADLSTLCDAIARGLGTEQLPEQDKAKELMRLLAGKDLLLVLDDLASPETGEAFLRTARPAGLPLLATSRTRMQEFDRRLPVGELERKAALALFRDEAGLTAADGEVEAICALLENHPLALIIAAGRVSSEGMPLTSLRERLSSETERLAALGESKGRSVYASVKLSYDSLDDAQKLVFTRLAACFGDTTGLVLLAQICGLSETECEDVVGGLVMRSLVEREGERIGLHRLVRDFGRAMLGDGLQTIQDRIVCVVTEYTRAHSEPVPEHHDRLQVELGNLLGAVEYANDREDWRAVMTLADLLLGSEVLRVRGYWGEDVHVGRTGMAAAEQVGDEAALASLEHNTAVMLQNQGDYQEARRLYPQSLEIKRTLGNQEGMAMSLHELGRIAQAQGNYAEAGQLYKQSLEINRALGIQRGIGMSLHQLGINDQLQGKYDEARQLYQQGLEISRTLRDQQGIASSLHQLGFIAQVQGDYQEARRLYQQSLEIKRALGNWEGVAISLHNLGRIAQLQANKQDARKLYAQALEILERLQSPYAATARRNLASLETRRRTPSLLGRLFDRRQT